ncbi:hypothetical protein CASFOL_024830 [Castilleja foliolosa]|uniref:Uncharacterized protein n=1 Tax=Castilleja foliolosa TaxID=1961234 RepID=A0ABD3CRC5_9LAMI
MGSARRCVLRHLHTPAPTSHHTSDHAAEPPQQPLHASEPPSAAKPHQQPPTATDHPSSHPAAASHPKPSGSPDLQPDFKRKFAAQLAVKQDCIIIDDDEDNDVPMFVQHTEALLEEIEKMDVRVEMEVIDGYDDEAVIDIYSGDKNNPLAVTDKTTSQGGEPSFHLFGFLMCVGATAARSLKYVVQGILLSSEGISCVSPNYMHHQSDINERMRGILID